MQFRASAPVSQAVAVLGGGPYSYFRYETHLASLKALEVYDEVAAEFEQITGRANPAVECYRTEDAEFVFIMMGAFATKARQAVDQLREAGWPIGLVRPRLFRPFPEAKIREALKGKQGVAVIDQNISFGRGGVLHTEIASTILGQAGMPMILVSFIGGLGGRDISAEEFYQMAEVLKQAVSDGHAPEPRLLYTENELREVRKLQDIARVERHELENES
jgi:pyruvate ferredoxin oxidoreductase alpha subunit